MSRLILLFPILLILLNPVTVFAQSPQVLTSIRPLQLITRHIMQGVGEPDVLIDGSQSPHHFQLRPSQLKQIAAADLLIWVSDDFETGISRLKDIAAKPEGRLALIPEMATDRLIGDEHDIDGHIWLSPQNVIDISRIISQRLSQIDPAHQSRYQDNTAKLIQKLANWQQQAGLYFREHQPRYLLDHQFLAYFERDFQLQAIGSLRNRHDHGSSIRQLKNLYQTLDASGAKCLLTPSLPLSAQARQLADRYQLQPVLIDILDQQGQLKHIDELLQRIFAALQDCV